MSRRSARKSAAANRANGIGGRAEAAQRGGGSVVPLQQPSGNQGMMGPNSEWFGPGRPLPGMGPRQSVGRRFDYNFGQNVLQSPRAGMQTSFAVLRALADGHDLTRLAIETRKDQMSRLKFGFGLVDDPEADLTPEQEARAKKYKKLLRRPDGKLFWKDWLRSVLEDLLVIDAPAIFVRRTNDESEIVGLYQVDGATIKPVIDEGGREPEPPECAYQQFIKGVPAFNYTSRMLEYRPRNVRVHTIYGYSPVEQILATINIALRRQMWQHAYFTNGNIPDSLIGVPSTWTPDQIRDFQDWFDGLLTGNTERRRGALFVPGEVAKSYVPTKDAEMFGAAEEWLARVVCFCFGISHQALVKEVNRATAGTAAEQALEDGLAPIQGWVKSLMDGILIDQFEETELEFVWVDDKELDPKVQDEIWAGRVERGAADRNEWRTAVGMKPRPEPEADMLMTSTTQNATALSLDDQIEAQTKRTASGVFPDPTQVNDPNGEDDPPPGGKGKGSASGGAGGKGGGAGKPASSPTPPKGKEGAEKGTVPFDAAGEMVSKASATSKKTLATLRKIGPTRPAGTRARKKAQKLLEKGLATVGARVTAAVAARLGELSKADTPDADRDALISAGQEAIGSWDFLIDPMADILASLAEDTARQAVAMIGRPAADALVDQINERAVANARDRAAELVGRRVLENGMIVDNPDARWSITDATRDMIHDTIVRVLENNEGSDTLIQELQDSHAFSPARAEMVSRTEIAGANSRAAMDAYDEARTAGVEVMKEWILGANPCEICQANADQGPIPLGETFESGDDEPPGHPLCECAIAPVVGEE